MGVHELWCFLPFVIAPAMSKHRPPIPYPVVSQRVISPRGTRAYAPSLKLQKLSKVGNHCCRVYIPKPGSVANLFCVTGRCSVSQRERWILISEVLLFWSKLALHNKNWLGDHQMPRCQGFLPKEGTPAREGGGWWCVLVPSDFPGNSWGCSKKWIKGRCLIGGGG